MREMNPPIEIAVDPFAHSLPKQQARERCLTWSKIQCKMHMNCFA